jgi:SAM-dependent methyltransferase
MSSMPRWFYDLMYRFTQPDWDSGVTPPQVVALIEGSSFRGRALDLGCGTGTNSIYLAKCGWTVVGVDFSPKAIELARQKAREAEADVDLQVGDVTRLDYLQGPFDLALDMGCFHGLDRAGRVRYVENLARLTRADSGFLLYAFDRPIFFGRFGITPEDVQRELAPYFSVRRMERGVCHGAGAVWYWFGRQ